MTQLEKYTWLIDTIRRAGKISLRDISDRWERDKDMSDYEPLPRATFNRWKEEIRSLFGINIECERRGGYHYYIENPEDIEEDELKKWMLDSFAVGNIISQNLAIKSRILVEQIPSGRDHLTPLVSAMQSDKVVRIRYRSFRKDYSREFIIEPYCVRLFENRWYLLGRNVDIDELRIYGLDRIEAVDATGNCFTMPADFSHTDYFARYFGIVVDPEVATERVVIRANRMHANYLRTLPLHHTQTMIDDCGEYADFEVRLAPTYDFIMKLLQYGSMIEVMEPQSLRRQMKGWVSELYDLYSNE